MMIEYNLVTIIGHLRLEKVFGKICSNIKAACLYSPKQLLGYTFEVPDSNPGDYLK